MKSTIGALLAVAGVAVAQSTTSLWLIGFDEQNVQGSIIASDKSATTYSLTCGAQTATATDGSDCGIPDSFTFTQGPSTVGFVLSVSDADSGVSESISIGCQITSSTAGMCTETYSGPPTDSAATGTANILATSTAPITAVSDLGLQAVTITAGPTSTPTTGGAKTTSGSHSGSSSGSVSGASATTSSSTGAAAVMVTKAPTWVGAVMGAGAMALAAL